MTNIQRVKNKKNKNIFFQKKYVKRKKEKLKKLQKNEDKKKMMIQVKSKMIKIPSIKRKKI